MQDHFGDFSSLEPCMDFSGTMNSIPEGEDSQVRTRSDPLGLVYKVYGLFTDRELHSTSERKLQTIEISIAYVWGGFWTTLTNNSKECFSYLVLGILIDSLSSLGSTITPGRKISSKLYTYTHTYELYIILGKYLSRIHYKIFRHSSCYLTALRDSSVLIFFALLQLKLSLNCK